MFVHVSPAQAATEAPKDARFYSDKNSLAANPDADQDTGVPKITGTQDLVAQTEDIPRNPFDRLQPAAPAASTRRGIPGAPARRSGGFDAGQAGL